MGSEQGSLDVHELLQEVSNLLGFPASGEEFLLTRACRLLAGVSNLLGFPASGEPLVVRLQRTYLFVSNLLGFPASGEAMGDINVPLKRDPFPIYWVSQRVGRLNGRLLWR